MKNDSKYTMAISKKKTTSETVDSFDASAEDVVNNEVGALMLDECDDGNIRVSKMTEGHIVHRNYLKLMHDQSILGIPQVGDWPAPTPCDPPYCPIDTPLNVGWICPKCGRSLAPHIDSCPYCSEPTTINIIC